MNPHEFELDASGDQPDAGLLIRARSAITAWYQRDQFAEFRLGFLQSIGQLLAGGNGSLQVALAARAKRERTPAIAEIYEQMVAATNSGKSFSQAISPFFAPSEASLVEAIEQGVRDPKRQGQLYVRCAAMLKPISKTTGVVVSTGFYAMAMILASLALWLVVGPWLTEAFGSVPKAKWPKLTTVMMQSAGHVRAWLVIYGPLFAGSLIAFVWSLSNWTGPLRERADDSLRIYGLYRAIKSLPIQVALGLGLSTKNGIRPSIEQVRQSANPWADYYLTLILDRTHKTGVDVIDVGLFPPVAMVEVETRALGGADLGQALSDTAFESFDGLAANIESTCALIKRAFGGLPLIFGGSVAISTAQLYLIQATSFVR